ncbi:SNARE domain protein [Aspergillus ambiguus]|uniref:SNARE domain protein n=1 Tax=Aspergillus ambiguus TaxID=176160 RepID=UPI003CCCD8F4
MRLHGARAFDPVLTMDPRTGAQPPPAMTIHRLMRYSHRERIARSLARHIIPTAWGAFTPDQSAEMDLAAELRLARRLERGLYVLFHMGDIARAVDAAKAKPRTKSKRRQRPRWADGDEDDGADNAGALLRWGYKEAEVGRRRLEFRAHLDEQTEIALHATLRLLRELTERLLLQHGPKDWHRDAKNEYSVVSWFLLRQSPRSLAKLFLSPADQCCGIEEKIAGGVGDGDDDRRECRFADPLDQYWRAWGETPERVRVGCQGCSYWRRVRSWSVKPALVDAGGREYNRAAERYLKEIDVLSTLQTTRPLFSSYLRIRSLAKTPDNPELQQSRTELETTLTDLSADLDDLVQSVRAIEQDPYRYGLELEEVQRRRKLVDDVGGEIEKMRLELQSAVTTAGAGAGALPNPAEFDPGSLGDEREHDEDYYASMEQQRQMELMHEQDEQLDGVFRTVGTLRQQANDMGRELEDQTVMIGEVDTLADRVGGKLQSGLGKIKYIVRKNEDTWSSFCIAALIFILVLLLILVVAL